VENINKIIKTLL